MGPRPGLPVHTIICTINKLCNICKKCKICQLHISIDPSLLNCNFCFCILRPKPVQGSGPLNLLRPLICKKKKNARNTICGMASSIERKMHTREQCWASDRSKALEILDRWQAISSLCCSDEQGVSAFQGLSRCWSYAYLLLNFLLHPSQTLEIMRNLRWLGNNAQSRIRHPRMHLLSADGLG